jgi:hypothetical protein
MKVNEPDRFEVNGGVSTGTVSRGTAGPAASREIFPPFAPSGFFPCRRARLAAIAVLLRGPRQIPPPHLEES